MRARGDEPTIWNGVRRRVRSPGAMHPAMLLRSGTGRGREFFGVVPGMGCREREHDDASRSRGSESASNESHGSEWRPYFRLLPAYELSKRTVLLLSPRA